MYSKHSVVESRILEIEIKRNNDVMHPLATNMALSWLES